MAASKWNYSNDEILAELTSSESLGIIRIQSNRKMIKVEKLKL